MTGRVWPQSGTGGTLNAQGTGPGPYYARPASDGIPMPGSRRNDTQIEYRAVNYAVRSIQRALNRRFGHLTLTVDGLYGTATHDAVKTFQRRQGGMTVDGVVGQETAIFLFAPLVEKLGTVKCPPCLVLGRLLNESAMDPGAVGVNGQDLGLCQIYLPAHPDLTESEAFAPIVAIDYAIALHEENLDALDGNQRDAVAAYNLGLGGCRTWISHGRPDVIDYYANPVEIKKYIDRVLSNCP